MSLILFLPVNSSSGEKKTRKKKHHLIFKAREKISSEKTRRNSICQTPLRRNVKAARAKEETPSWLLEVQVDGSVSLESQHPDVGTCADNHFSCLDKGYYKYSCSHHHCYQSDIPEEIQHFWGKVF